MSTINERINMMLAETGMKKTDLAKKLKISDASVSNICSGKTNPSGQTITAIVRECGINEAWLVNGEGEMFAPKTELDELTDLFAEIMGADDNDAVRNLAIAFAKLSKDQRKAAAEIAAQLARNMDK